MPPQAGSQMVKTGLPLIVLTVGGWLGLSYVLKGRYDAKDAQRTVPDLHAPVVRQRAQRFDIQEELRRLRGPTVETEYTNKPIGRPKDLE